MSSTDLALETLLAEDLGRVVARERGTFDALAHPFERSVVLVGAGYMGGKALRALRAAGIEPLAIADDNAAIRGTLLGGVLVMSWEQAAARFGSSAAFVVTLLRPEFPFVAMQQRLLGLGCARVLSGIALFWAHPAQTMPHAYVDLPSRIIDAAGEVRAAYRLLADEDSRRQYVAQLRYRLQLDFGALPPELPVAEQYFPSDLLALRDDETFVDCGAFDGDTVKSFLAHCGAGFARLLALEPDPANFQKLLACLETVPVALRNQIDVRPFAVGSIDGTLRFDGRGTNGSLLSSTGGVEVECRRLDTLLADEAPTFIKMDIEGAELDALAGVGQTCARARPVLAVCVYHVQDHLWRIPLRLHALSDEYSLFLRAYMKEGMELVCYAIPRSRLV